MLRDAATGEDWPAVGQSINALMQERRITQQALAAASGVSVATLRELQRGTNRRRAHDTTLIAIARALGWPDDHLLAVLLGEPPRDVAAPPRPCRSIGRSLRCCCGSNATSPTSAHICKSRPRGATAAGTSPPGTPKGRTGQRDSSTVRSGPASWGRPVRRQPEAPGRGRRKARRRLWERPRRGG